MAVRTISRDATNSRTILVWPDGVGKDDVKTNAAGAHYAKLYGEVVQPAAIPADTFKNAFGFVPLTGSVCRYIMRKARKPESVQDKLVNGLKALVREVMDED